MHEFSGPLPPAMANRSVAHQAAHPTISVASRARGTRRRLGGSQQMGIDTDRFPIQREKQWPLPGAKSAATVSVSVRDL